MRLGVWILAAFALLNPLPAMTVLPTDFDRLIDQAEQIFRGRVVAQETEWAGGGADVPRHLVTFVTFQVEESFRGGASGQVRLRLFGGRKDGRSQRIAGMPEFRVGDAEILFVRGNGRELCPLVGVHHGRLRVLADASGAGEKVHLHDGTPLRELSQIGRSSELARPAASAAGPALHPTEFGERIRAALRARGIQPAAPRR